MLAYKLGIEIIAPFVLMTLQQMYFSLLNLKVPSFSFKMTWRNYFLPNFIRMTVDLPRKPSLFNSRIFTLIWHRITFWVFFRFSWFLMLRLIVFINSKYMAKKLQQKSWQQSFLEITQFVRQIPEFYDIFRKCATPYSFLMGHQ